MIFPMQQFIEFQGNIYEITCAATRRAFQLAAVCDPVLDELGGKVVSAAAQQVFSGTVDYRIEPQELG